MPNVCNIPNCKGNYKSTGPCKIFRLPKDNHEMKKWLNVLPLKSAEVNVKTFRICYKHWPNDAPMVKVQGGGSRPKLTPSLFDVPSSSLPTPKPPPRFILCRLQVKCIVEFCNFYVDQCEASFVTDNLEHTFQAWYVHSFSSKETHCKCPRYRNCATPCHQAYLSRVL